MAGNIIDELAQIQTILTQITNPNSDFNKWSKRSPHKARVEAFSQQLGSLLQQVRKRPGPNNPPALTDFMTAVNRLIFAGMARQSLA